MTFDQLMGKSYTGSDPVVNRIYQNNQRYFSEILNHLKRNAIVPLIGAGFSASAYPGWKKLFMDMAKPCPNCQPEVEDHLNHGRFEEAASALRDEMVEHDFLEELYRIFGEHTLPGAMDKLSAARKSLPNLFRSTVITTNFERVIEEIYQHSLEVICPHTDYQLPKIRRALQNGKPVLFKLHGDIEDRDNIVITEEGYDRFYGEGSTLVETLTSILSNKLVLFLGCSLETDRVLKVLKRCGKDCTYYALLGLPEETKNDADPFSPRLCTPDGKEIEAYRTRRQFLSQHNINCIWYPYEQYEALDVLLQALCPPGGPSPAFPVPKALRTLIGRDSIIQTVYRKCTGGEPVFVTGPGGIGKTEVCHSVLRQMAQAGFSVIYVNLIGVTSALVFCETVADASGSDRLSGEQAGDMAGYLAYLRKKLSAFDKPVLYCDNWEDLWQNLQEDEKLPLLTWLAGGIPALVSSRVFPTDYDVPLQCIEIPPLNHDTGEDRALFVQVYQNKKKSNKPLNFAGPEFAQLLRQLDGHPLSIVLAATQTAMTPSWAAVFRRWTTAKQKTSNSRHASLETALRISWDSVYHQGACITLWGLLALYRGALPVSLLQQLAENPAQWQQWEDSIGLLHQASLLDWTGDGAELIMLQPVKEAFFLLAAKAELAPCVQRWYALAQGIFAVANQLHHPNRQDAHARAVELLPQALYLLQKLLDHCGKFPLQAYISQLDNLLTDYFMYDASRSADILQQLSQFYQEGQDYLGLANALLGRANLLSRLGKPDQALDLYRQAEGLYRQVKDNLGLAHALRGRANLLSRLGKPDQALDLYRQAEGLYRLVKDNLGLAHALRGRANLLSRLGKPEQALDLYRQAEGLYRQEQDNLGLANALLGEADLLSLLGKPEQALDLYRQAEGLYRQEQDNLGLANALRGEANLLSRLGKPDQALDLYCQAEGLYRQEQHNLGLANALSGRANLLSLLGSPDQALDLYRQAESLYRQEQDNLGLANALLGEANLLSRLGKPDQALDLYRQAEGLYRQEQANLGLANALRGEADLLLRLGKPDQALDLYRQAEGLYRQVKDNLGLANAYFAQGKLFRQNNQLSDAARALEQALPLYESEGISFFLAMTCALLSRIYLQLDEQVEKVPALVQRARDVAKMLPPQKQERIEKILDSQ